MVVPAAIVAMSLLIVAWPSFARAGGDPPLTDPPYTVDHKPVDVKVGTVISDLSEIDEVTERFDVSGYLFASWKDPRLAFTPSGAWEKTRRYPLDRVWSPSLEFVNGVAPHSRYDRALMASPDGTVNYIERYAARLSSPFHLRKFPFDHQSLDIIIRVFITEMPSVIFHTDPATTWIGETQIRLSFLDQWELEQIVASAGETPIDAKGHMASQVRFSIQVKRRSTFYLWKVYLPLILMVVLSWTVFFIDPVDLATQAQVSVTTILTVIAFGFAISLTMPKVPYLTAIDAFFLVCYIFVFLTAIEIITVNLAHRSTRPTALKVRRFTRLWLPLAFVVVNAILFLVYFV